MGEYAAHEGTLDARGLRFAIGVARFNRDITEGLLDGAQRALAQHGADDDDVTVWWVPGAFELPVLAKRLASSGKVDAVICLGAVVRGETAHFDYVAGGATQGLVQAAVETGSQLTHVRPACGGSAEGGPEVGVGLLEVGEDRLRGA